MDSLLDGARAPKHQSRRDASSVRMPAEKTSAAVNSEPIHFADHANEQMVATRHQRIAIVAYLKAEARGFAPGCEADDWLAAQLEVDAKDCSIFA